MARGCAGEDQLAIFWGGFFAKMLHRYRKQSLVHISQQFASDVLSSSLVMVQDTRGGRLRSSSQYPSPKTSSTNGLPR